MFRTLKNAWRVPELRTKLLFTLLVIVIYRLGASIIVPYVDSSVVANFSQTYSGTIMGWLNTLSGNALSQASLFALSVSPYITASIVMQLLTIAIPPLERMAKEEDGKNKINTITRYVTVALSIITAFGYTTLLDGGSDMNGDGVSESWLIGNEPIVFRYFVIIVCFCAGASVIMWLAEKINEKGIGNGISIILFANIIASLPTTVKQMAAWCTKFVITSEGNLGYGFNLAGTITAVVVAAVMIGLVVLAVWFTNSERRIPIQYAKRVVGRKMYGGQGTNLPIKMNMAGVMPIIFASSIVSIPATIVTMFRIDNNNWFGWFVNSYLQPNTWTYIVLYLVLLVAFSYFYIMISFNPVEVANNIRNNGGAVPGIRPGKPTSDYIKRILNRVTFIGALFLGLVACVPMIPTLIPALAGTVGSGSFTFGGSSMLILVGVALETYHDIEAQLTMRNYKGFLD